MKNKCAHLTKYIYDNISQIKNIKNLYIDINV